MDHLLEKYPMDHFAKLTPHEQLVWSYILYCTVKAFYEDFMEFCRALEIPCGPPVDHPDHVENHYFKCVT